MNANKKRTQILRDIIITILILCATFFISLAIHTFFDTDALISSLFILAVFLIALSTNGILYGLISAPLCVLAVNFAFTFPFFAFDFTLQENIVSAIIMVIVTLSTSALTSQLKKQKQIKRIAIKQSMRADLLRAISHDLKTPLTVIYGASSTILDNYDSLSDESKTEIISNIQQDSQWLIRMVENLLSVTKLDNKDVTLIKSEVVLEELIDSVLTKLKKHFPSQSVSLTMPDTFITISADAILIEQVLINLLENAIKHAKGMKTLSLDIEMKEETVTFRVIDDGCGMEKEKLKNIFSGYLMSEDVPTEHRERHMGIGLSVCSAIVKAHGGELFAKNRKSGGMIFGFSLTAQEAQDE